MRGAFDSQPHSQLYLFVLQLPKHTLSVSFVFACSFRSSLKDKDEVCTCFALCASCFCLGFFWVPKHILVESTQSNQSTFDQTICNWACEKTPTNVQPLCESTVTYEPLTKQKKNSQTTLVHAQSRTWPEVFHFNKSLQPGGKSPVESEFSDSVEDF